MAEYYAQRASTDAQGMQPHSAPRAMTERDIARAIVGTPTGRRF